ncbi:MAG: carboxypeptidase-like regulatory domain-containing protein [Myxococcota bacterium]
MHHRAKRLLAISAITLVASCAALFAAGAIASAVLGPDEPSPGRPHAVRITLGAPLDTRVVEDSADWTPNRTIRGQVLDPQGRPVEGALVVGGGHLVIHDDELSGTTGVLTEADGTFSLPVYTRWPMQVVATHPQLGLSSMVEDRDRNTSLLTLRPFTWLEGTVEGPRDAFVTVVDATNRKIGHLGSVDALGRYRIGPLPPGPVTVDAISREPDGSAAWYATEAVLLEPGTPLRHTVHVGGAASLAISTPRPDGMLARATDLVVLQGDHAPTSPAGLRELQGSLPLATYEHVSAARRDGTPFHLRGMAAGRYTACALWLVQGMEQQVTCEPVDVAPNAAAAVELSLAALG